MVVFSETCRKYIRGNESHSILLGSLPLAHNAQHSLSSCRRDQISEVEVPVVCVYKLNKTSTTASIANELSHGSTRFEAQGLKLGP